MVGDTAGLMPCARERMNEWRESLVVTLERRVKSVLDSGDRDMSRRWTMWRGNLRTGLQRAGHVIVSSSVVLSLSVHLSCGHVQGLASSLSPHLTLGSVRRSRAIWSRS